MHPVPKLKNKIKKTEEDSKICHLKEKKKKKEALTDNIQFFNFIGVDYHLSMIDKAKKHIFSFPSPKNFTDFHQITMNCKGTNGLSLRKGNFTA